MIDMRSFVIALAACASSTPWGHATTAEPTPRKVIDIAVTRTAFAPDRVVVHVGDAVTLRFTRTVERTCAKQVIVGLDADHEISRDLPVGTPVDIGLSFDRPGELVYSCGMRMLGGTIVVER